MKYKGIKLTEFKSDKPVVFDPPKEMLVWDCEDDVPKIRDVCAVVHREYSELSVIGSVMAYCHCAEIPEETKELKPRRATNLELAKWLAQGNGIYRLDSRPDYWDSDMTLNKDTFECPVNQNIQVRKWDDEKWHEPTADYMGLEE